MSSRLKLLTSLLLASTPVFAEQGSLAASQTPNLYEFAHPSGGLIYRLDPVTGDPVRFAYRDRYHVFETGAEGIRVQETELGQQITVDLAEIPDLRSTTLTLILPRVNLVPDDIPPPEPPAMPEMLTAFVTLAIHRTSIAGPDILSGQVDIYGLMPMVGKAQYGTEDAPAQASTGVIGRVLLEPTCPVAAEGQPPCIGPFAGARVWLTHDILDVVYETVADERGLFAIEASGGEYTLHAAGTGPFPICPETTVAIPEVEIQIFPWPETREYAVLRCDTGIR